jgi:cell division protein FtsB
MSENTQTKLNELQNSLDTFQQFRHSVWASIFLMLIGVVFVIGSVYYSITRLQPLESQIAQKQNEIAQKTDEINKLEERIKELKKTTQSLLPNNFTGKFGIPLETDTELKDAKINVYEKGKDNGFDPVYIFKVADGYRTVAIFDSWEKAREKKPLAEKVNATANEIVEFKEFCSNPKWAEEGGYFDCLKE